MINDKEIKAVADDLGIPPQQVEKDYVYGWILKAINEHPTLGPQMILKGGNALRKVHFRDTRFSKDLDFSLETSISDATLHDALREVCGEVQDNVGVEFEMDRTTVEEKGVHVGKDVLEARVYFKGFFGDEKISLKTQLDVTQFDKSFLPAEKKSLIHPYSDADSCRAIILCQQAEEVLASKLVALMHRRRVGDLFDLMYSLVMRNDLGVSKRKVMEAFLKRSIYGQNPESAKLQLKALAVDESESEWGKLVVPKNSVFDFLRVREGFVDLIESVFSEVPQPLFAAAGGGVYGRSVHGSFPPAMPMSADHRESIIRAGRGTRLVEIRYNGVLRRVEPYKIEYRVRGHDGRYVEYFWGYDLVGGSSGPGIKMFIADKIETLSETSETFVPRYNVEV